MDNASPLGPIVDRFLAYLKGRERSANTIRAYGQDLSAFAVWYQAATGDPLDSPGQVTGVELREWKRDMLARGGKPASVNRRLSALQAFARWAADCSLIPSAPERPTTCRQERTAPKWLDRRDRLAFLRAVEHASPRDRALAQVLLNTGLRVAELAALKWPDVRISDRKGTLTVRRGKGSKWREVPLNDDARKALLAVGYAAASAAGESGPVLRGTRGALGVQGIRKAVGAIASKAGVEATCHTLRHTFCHDLIAAGIGIEKVASLAGHDNIQTTRRYVEPSAADLQAAVDRLGG